MNMKKWIVFKMEGEWMISPPITLDREEYEAGFATFEEAWQNLDKTLEELEKNNG